MEINEYKVIGCGSEQTIINGLVEVEHKKACFVLAAEKMENKLDYCRWMLKEDGKNVFFLSFIIFQFNE